MNFTNFNLSQPIIKAINKRRFFEATNVQQEVIPAILAGKDVVVKAKTGSGKTGAFAIPIIDKINPQSTSPKALVITPTRELAMQICDEFTSFGLYKDINSMVVYGQTGIQTQIDQLNETIHIVVGTPGRINDLIRREALKLDQIDFFVLDEADELINRGFFEDVINIMQQISSPHQTLLFSATMPIDLQDLCQSHFHNPYWVDIIEDAPKIKEINYLVEDKWKFLRFRQSLELINPYTCIIFCNTRANVDDLYNRMRQVGIKPLRLHGGMKQRDRLKTINSFKEGNVQCLIATDLVARGLHINSLDLVVNYDVPQIAENYVHRIGRTGRVNEDGIAITLFTPSDDLYRLELEKYLGAELVFTSLEPLNTHDLGLQLSKSEKHLLNYSHKNNDI